MPDDAQIRRELERLTLWTRQNRHYHVSKLAKTIASQKFALYVLAHQAGVKLGEFGVDDETLLKVGELSEQNPSPRELGQAIADAGNKSRKSSRRSVATIMFVDIVNSTRLRSTLGNEKYSALLLAYREKNEQLLNRHSGNHIKNTGDGFLATFSLPTNAVRCGLALAEAARDLGIEVRVGIHTAEILFREGDIEGLGVDIAARVEAAGRPGRVLVSATVKGVLEGSEFRFESAGSHQLKGVDGDRELFLV